MACDPCPHLERQGDRPAPQRPHPAPTSRKGARGGRHPPGKGRRACGVSRAPWDCARCEGAFAAPHLPGIREASLPHGDRVYTALDTGLYEAPAFGVCVVGEESSGETRAAERWVPGSETDPATGRQLSAEHTVGAPCRSSSRKRGIGSYLRGPGARPASGPGGGQALGPLGSHPRGQRHSGTSLMRRARTAPTPAAGRASVSTEGQEVTFALSTLTLLMVCSVSKDKTCKEKTGKKIDPLSSLSRQDRRGPSRHPAGGPTRNGPVRMETGVTRHTELRQSRGGP